ncbi:MAG: DUF3841 domain-containing protein [Armatimonas sp.]
MRLWTIQPVAIWELIQREGLYRCNPELVSDGKDWPEGYDWLAGQMRARVGPPPPGVRWPVWAWEKKPDLRSYLGRNNKEPYVRLTLEVPDSDVLLSEFEDWHFVLWNSYLALTEAEADANENATLAERETSWERIFDLDYVRDAWQGGGGREARHVQATLWEIRREYVRRAEIFMPRKSGGSVDLIARPAER